MAKFFTNELEEKERLKISAKSEIHAKTEGKNSPIIIVSESFFLLLAILAISLGVVWWGLNESWDMKSIIELFAPKEKKVEKEKQEKEEKIYTGKGETREKALLNAKKNAILQELGEWISATTQVKEFTLVQQEILSKAEGYVAEVEIVSEKQKESLWEVEIQCKISAYKIMNSLIENPYLKAFQQKRVVVTFNKELQDQAQKAGITQLARHVEEFLNNKGFKIFIEEMALSLFREIADEFQDFLSSDTLEKIKELGTDFMVCLHAEKRESQNKGTLLKITVLARNRVGVNFASFTREYPVKSLGTVSDWEEAVNECIAEVNELFYRTLLHKISKGDEFTLHFQNYTPSWHDRIEKAMHSLPYSWNVVDRKKGLTIDLTGLDDVGYEVRKALNRSHIPLEWNSMGNWFFIRKPNLWRIWGSISFSLVLFGFCTVLIIRKSWKKVIKEAQPSL